MYHLAPLTLGMQEEAVALVFFGGLTCVGVVAIVSRAVRAIFISRQVEQSRRDIAAYIAEGSMSPEDGVRLMASGPADLGHRPPTIPRA